MPESFDPYLRWLGIRDPERPPNHYRLLGVEPFEADPDVLIHAADRQMAHVRSFQTGPHSAESQKLLNELAAAKVCLLSPAKKAEYDGRLRAAMAKRRVRPAAPPANPPPPPAGPVRPPVPPPVIASEPPPVPTLEEPPPLPDAASWPGPWGAATSSVPHRARTVARGARPFSRLTALLISTAVALLGAVAVAILGLLALSALSQNDGWKPWDWPSWSRQGTQSEQPKPGDPQ